MARGVLATRSGAPLADAVTPKLDGFIRKLGRWLPTCSMPLKDHGACASTTTARIRAATYPNTALHNQGRTESGLVEAGGCARENAPCPHPDVSPKDDLTSSDVRTTAVR